MNLRKFKSLFDADGTKKMQSRYPLLSIEAVRIGYESHDKTSTIIAAGVVFGVAGGGPTLFTNDAGDFPPVPELLAGLLTIAFASILVEATFRLLERGTVVRWGMKVGRE